MDYAEKNILSKELLKFGNQDASSKLESFYMNILQACPSLNLKTKQDFDQKVVIGYKYLDGLYSCDFYLKEFDMVVEFDGPCHFFQGWYGEY